MKKVSKVVQIAAGLALLAMFTAVFCAGTIWAGTTGKITGRVTDSNTGEPLLTVNVIVEGTSLGASTNADGVYFILSVPAGTYTVKASMMGYKEVVVRNVLMQSDLTSRVDFRLEPTVLKAGEEVVVIAEKPLIEKDVTASRQTRTSDELALMPVDNINQVLTLTAGAVDQDGNLHIRGGRNREVAYLIDGALVADPLTGGFDADIPTMALEEVSVTTGGFGAEYGSAQSGVVNMILKEGGTAYNGAFNVKTSDFSGFRKDPWHEQLWDIQGSLGGPVPYAHNVRFFLSSEYAPTQGDYPHDDKNPLTVQGKLTYTPTPKVKLALSGLLFHDDYNQFDFNYSQENAYNLWRRTSYEDFNPDIIEDPALASWYGNGQMDTEWRDSQPIGTSGYGTYEQVWADTNGDGVQENIEWNDLNGNGVMDSEDLNANSGLDSYNMLDHLPDFKSRADQFGFTLTHTLSEKTFYEARLNRYRTYWFYNVNETTNEDQDGDGRLDMGERIYDGSGHMVGTNDFNGDGIIQPTEDLNDNGEFDQELDSNHDGIPDYGHDLGLDGIPFTNDFGENDGATTTEDLDNDGRFDHTAEDLNGNGLWDYRVFGTGKDLYADVNHNGYVDASESGADSLWIKMSDLPMFGVGSKDDDGFFKYGVGNTYHRDRWHEDEKFIYNTQFHMTSQVNENHQMKFGVEGSYYDIFNYEVDAASGGNVYGENYRVFPYSMAGYVQDKMEFEGLIVNAGLRFDYFNANYDGYPADIHDPVIDPGYGGVIKNPTKVPAKSAWSPRLGVSHPITDRDILYFNYGRYFQVPRFDFMFENLTFQLTGAFPRMGNANLKPEQTTSYELGVKHQFANDLVLQLTGFYKDITGLTDTRQIYYSASNWYGIYDNTDYGNVRGFEIGIIRPRVRYLSANLTYTYSFARGKNSSPTADYVTVWEGNNVPTTEVFLDWDQRHTISADFDLRTVNNQRFFGLKGTENLGFNLIVSYGSGLPWSPPSRDRDKWKYTNTERMPYNFSMDFVADKGFRWRRLYTKVFVEARNLGMPMFYSSDRFPFFNIESRQNIVDIADTEWYANQVDQYGNETHDPAGRYGDPTVYSLPAIIRVGAAVQF
jgi:outer membrane receptor protein involved in Fe transport